MFLKNANSISSIESIEGINWYGKTQQRRPEGTRKSNINPPLKNIFNFKTFKPGCCYSLTVVDQQQQQQNQRQPQQQQKQQRQLPSPPQQQQKQRRRQQQQQK